MMTYYLWLKAGHIAFMVTWFAGLFYLPRLFIYHAEADDAVGRERFCVMERRLFVITTIGAALTLVFGLLLLWANPSLAGVTWFQTKLILLIGLAIYHWSLSRWMRKLSAGYRTSNTKKLRWYNEVPVFFLLAIVALAVAKPF